MPELWEWIAVGGCDLNPHTSPPTEATTLTNSAY